MLFLLCLLLTGHLDVFAQNDSTNNRRPTTQILDEVEVRGSKSAFRLEGARKVFDVDKSIAALGGTAVDVIRNIPTLDVDIDGNVIFRGQSPRIFVNDKPTDLTLEQIPSLDIQRIELISMPSAKYEANSSGGILNVVLKENTKRGVNGMLMLGVDRLLGFRGGGTLNYGLDKWTFSLRTFLRDGKSELTQTTNRTLINDIQQELISNTKTDGTSRRSFLFLSPEVKYKFNTKSSLTLRGRFFFLDFNIGKKTNTGIDSTDFKINTLTFENRFSENKGDITLRSYGLLFEHKMKNPKSKWSAEVRAQEADVKRPLFLTINTTHENNKTTKLQETGNQGTNFFSLASTDFSLQINKLSKIEFGGLLTLRYIDFKTSLYNDGVQDANNSSDYINTEIIGGLYTTFSQSISNFSYQVGLRLESSSFNADIKNKNVQYAIDYPIIAFPSFAVQYEFKNKSQLQFLYSYKISRPSFFQTIPIVDYSNPLNISTGNPNLKPSFIHLGELNYNVVYPKMKNSSLLLTLYYKNTNDLITSFFKEITNAEGITEIIRTPFNSGSLYTAGLEIIPRFVITNWYEMTPNINLLYGKIVLDEEENKADVSSFSYFIKLNQTLKLPKNWRIQIIAKYNSESVVPPNSSNGGRRGRLNSNISAQGEIASVFSMEIGFEKSWKKKLFFSVNVNDILGSNYKRITTRTTTLDQLSSAIRNPYYLSVNLRYIFGQTNNSRNKRPPNNQQSQSGNNDVGLY